MTRIETRFGHWSSDWSAADAAAASRDFAEIRAGHGGLFWIEYDPADARCTLWFWREGRARCLTPAGFSLRSRVYEYGGGAFCLTEGGIAFVNEADQQIYLQSLADGETSAKPQRLTARDACRYADLQHDQQGGALIAVEECAEPRPVTHRLVAIALADGARQVVAQGPDFYSSPTLSGDGSRLAWIEWSRPEQPWTATRLHAAHRVAANGWRAEPCIAGEQGGESLQQPRFDTAGRLHCLSDRAGWWQPWREQDGTLQPLPAPPVDHAPAPWQLGTVSYLPLDDGGLLLTRIIDGHAWLFEQRADGSERQLAAAFSRCRQLASDERRFYCIAGASERLPAVLAIDRQTGAVSVLAGGEQPLADDQLARPQPLSFATGAGETAHAFFYAPRNATCQGLADERAPLVVFLHGGPTSACYPVFDPRIQFWTQRGFAVADVNYRGSSGFGRAYRQRLQRQWGVVDVEDACAVSTALAAAGLVDAQRVFIRGASAGGYTALCALAGDGAFRGGASLYGVSDPLALGKVTHKFEGDYLDWLIGDPHTEAERYRLRAPLHNAQRIKVPVIFLQGGLDAVVLPEQTESMVAALRARQVRVEYHLYPQERHGFRSAANLADALEREYRFYQALLD